MWKNVYNEKLKSIEEAILSLPKTVTVVVGLAASEAQGFLSNVHKYKDHFDSLRVLTCLDMKEYPFFENKEYEGKMVNHSWFFSPPTRKARENGLKTVDYIPNNLHMAGTDKLVAEKNEGRTLVFWGTVSPMHEDNGFFSLGISNVYEMEVFEQADRVILEVNDQMPFLHGETGIHINQADAVVENSWEVPTLPAVEPTETEVTIAQYIADLVEDGSTIQIGIGGIPNAVAKLLDNKKDLGVHTEMFTESMIDLFECGAINNTKKTLWRGKSVCAFALGSKRMYKWLNDNPGVWFMRGHYVNDPYVIAQNDNMISINTAISVDLQGQVVSEAIGARQFSGTGGQLDTHRGAIKSKNGKGIIALRSTAKNGKISTITVAHPKGATISVPRHDVDYVVTEFGVAHLRGKSLSERVKLLISIAHPNYREQLKREAKEIGYIL